MPQLHLLRSSYDLVVYDFPYDFFDIVGGNMLPRLRLHCLRSPYDFFPQGDRTIIVPSPWGYRTMTARCQYDFMSPAWASCGDLAATLRVPYDERKRLRSFFGKNDNLKSRVVLRITVRCTHGDRTMFPRRVYGLRAYDFFKFVIVRS